MFISALKSYQDDLKPTISEESDIPDVTPFYFDFDQLIIGVNG
jgi:hypothetical protein